MIYVYPKFRSRIDIGIRIGGMGLANCLLVYARALCLAKKLNAKMIAPTWEQFNFGPYLRQESDKRHYFNIFKKEGISGGKKYFLLKSLQKISENELSEIEHLKYQNLLIEVKGVQPYFKDLIAERDFIVENVLKLIHPFRLNEVQHFSFSRKIGIHIRLGDYHHSAQKSLDWYLEIIRQIDLHTNCSYNFLLFSDGKPKELTQLLNYSSRIQHIHFGSSIADLVALSKCEFIIGSNSTFSAWASFMGNKMLLIPEPKGYLNDFSGLDYFVLDEVPILSREVLGRVIKI
ncbi:alpha-1,2-fucosyltransferase [Arcicella rosea]|uniref:Glycosyl transferase family 11 n=1 Tax=Arcicella rosea TaxID=502909 RepID=A0A841EVQ8_9BACT|nr:alpha-1,2-fucosyltransferase [Arcicella rosea]MBB6005143.1 hypothetical protein [Arcicella rosea]